MSRWLGSSLRPPPVRLLPANTVGIWATLVMIVSNFLGKKWKARIEVRITCCTTNLIYLLTCVVSSLHHVAQYGHEVAPLCSSDDGHLVEPLDRFMAH